MNLDRENTKKIIGISCFCICFYLILRNFGQVKRFLLDWFQILLPVVLGACIAFVLNPLVRMLENRVFVTWKRKFPRKGAKMARGVSVLITFLVVFGVVMLIPLVILPEVSDALVTVSKRLPEIVEDALKQVTLLSEQYGLELNLPTGNELDWNSLFASISSVFSMGDGGKIFSGALGIATTLVETVFNFVMAVVIAIHILLHKEAIKRFFKRLLQAYLPGRFCEPVLDVLRLSNSSFRNFVSGQLTEAIVFGCLTFLSMTLLQFPYVLPIAAIMAFMTLIPILGAWIGAILGALLCLTVSPMDAVLFLVFIVVLQQIDGNLVYPRIVGSSMKLPSLLVLVAIMVGGDLAGIVGMLLGVPVCSILYTLVKQGIERRLKPACVRAGNGNGEGKASKNEKENETRLGKEGKHEA